MENAKKLLEGVSVNSSVVDQEPDGAFLTGEALAYFGQWERRASVS